MPSEESIKSTIDDAIVKENLGAEHKEKETDRSSVSSCDTLLTQYTPIELDNDDIYHASLCSKVVSESTDTKQCSQLLQSSSRRSLQAVAMTQQLDQVAFPKCMIARFLDDSGNQSCFVVFDDFKFQTILEVCNGSTLGAG